MSHPFLLHAAATPLADVCQMFLLRHGATANNVAQPPRIQGRGSDPGLSEEGRRQADEAARLLAGVPLAAVFASPMRRSLETAERVAAPHGLVVQTVAELVECDVGRWEGRTWPEVERDDAEYHALFRADPALHGYAGGENLSQVLARIKPALDGVLGKHGGANIAVVGHNIVNRCYLADALGIPLARARDRLVQHNCGVNLIRHRAGKSSVVTLNAVWHLSRWEG